MHALKPHPNAAKNRRIEITLQPNIEELVAAPALKQAP
jgi:hypothetical protein